MQNVKLSLSLIYSDAIDHFRSMVSYLSELKKSDPRSTTQWYHLERDLKKNLNIFYTKYISKYGSEELKQEFKNYVNNIIPQKHGKNKKGAQKAEEYSEESKG